MLLTIDGTEYPVAAGATATFQGDVPHTYQGAGTEPCELVMTVQLPPRPGRAAS